MARFSSSRHSLHRHLRFSGLRKGDDSPLGSLLLRAKPNAFLIPRSSIQNRRLCDPNVTCRIRLLLFDAVSSWRSLKIYQDVLVVMYLLQKSGGEIYDAVVLGTGRGSSTNRVQMLLRIASARVRLPIAATIRAAMVAYMMLMCFLQPRNPAV